MKKTNEESAPTQKLWLRIGIPTEMTEEAKAVILNTILDVCPDGFSVENCELRDNDIKELRGQLIDIVEEYLEETCVPDKDAVFIKGDDYDKLAARFTETLKNWKLI